MGATNVGVRRAHPYLWSLSSPQQPLETEDSPTVSSCPTIYIATRVPCKIHPVNSYEAKQFPTVLAGRVVPQQTSTSSTAKKTRNYFKPQRKIFTTLEAKLLKSVE
jgi:hypothetical protein